MSSKVILTAITVAFCIALRFLVNWLGWWNWLEPIVDGIEFGLIAMNTWCLWRAHRRLEGRVKQRRFEMTFLLREGYEAGAPEHSIADVDRAYALWMQARCDADKKFVTALTDTCTFTFPLGGKRVVQAPGVMLTGSLSPLYDKNRSRAEVVETLTDLARHIMRELNQPRMYFSFDGVQYTVVPA